MRKLAVVLLLACELALGGCSSSRSTSTAATTSGLWEAVLAGGSGEGSALSFIMDFTVNGDGSVNVSQFSFNTTQTCFASQSESGTSSLTTDASGTVTGTITFVVTSNSPSGNTLTLMGNETSSSSITGSWTLAGSTDCASAGTFTMTKSS